MKVGDIIQEKSIGIRSSSTRRGLIVQIDPLLRRGWRQPPLNEIVIMLTDGTLWHANPTKWEYISEV
jgi:hypothetical protein